MQEPVVGFCCRWADDGAAAPPPAGADLPLRPHRHDRSEDLPRTHHPRRTPPQEDGHGEESGDIQLRQQDEDALRSVAGTRQVGFQCFKGDNIKSRFEGYISIHLA